METELQKKQQELVELRNRIMEEFKKAGLVDLQVVGFLEFLKLDAMNSMFAAAEPKQAQPPAAPEPAAPVQPQGTTPAPQPLPQPPQKPVGE